MNLKFWPRPSHAVKPIPLDDPAWPQKARALQERLANTPENDPLMAGILGLIEREIAIQMGNCERPGLTDAQAHSLTSRIGILVGLKRDLEQHWKEARAQKPPGAPS